MKVAHCKGCGSEILWRYTPAMKLMPLDVGLSEQPLAGTYVVLNDEDCRPPEPMFDLPTTEYHMNHWATCPRSKEFKR